MKDLLSSLEDLKTQGRTLVGCFPLYPPLELLHSFGLTPLVLWGLREDISSLARSDRHLQPYACGVARCLSELVLSRGGEILDALFMYNACDTLRNLPEILESSFDQYGRSLPVFRVHIPAVPLHQSSAAGYLNRRIDELVSDLEKFTGKSFSPQAFLNSIELYRRQRLLCSELEESTAGGSSSFADCAEVLLTGNRLPVEDHIALLEHALRAADHRAAGHDSLRIMVSGILPPPRDLLQTTERAGLKIVANDLACLKRSYAYRPAATEDPGEYYQDFYGNHYPCTTILPSADRRIETIRRTVREKKIAGFIFIGEKFCEYEYFEIPALEQALKSDGVQVLILEMGMEDNLNLDAYRTRIEAFAEMLGQETRRKEASDVF